MDTQTSVRPFIIGLVFALVTALPQRCLAQKLPAYLESTYWMREKWVGDDKPYQDVTKSIDAAVAHGKSPETLAAEYYQAYQKNKYDQMTVFRLAYASLAAVRKNSSFTSHPEWTAACNAMPSVPSPHTYEFDRLHFLVDSRELGAPTTYLDAGLRLLKRNPNDFDVKFETVEMTEPALDPKQRRLAFQFVADLKKMTPGNYKLVGLEGFIYDISFLERQRPDDARGLIRLYTQFLKVAPANAEFRPTAQERIDRAMKWLLDHHMKINNGKG